MKNTSKLESLTIVPENHTDSIGKLYIGQQLKNVDTLFIEFDESSINKVYPDFFKELNEGKAVEEAINDVAGLSENKEAYKSWLTRLNEHNKIIEYNINIIPVDNGELVENLNKSHEVFNENLNTSNKNISEELNDSYNSIDYIDIKKITTEKINTSNEEKGDLDERDYTMAKNIYNSSVKNGTLLVGSDHVQGICTNLWKFDKNINIKVEIPVNQKNLSMTQKNLIDGLKEGMYSIAYLKNNEDTKNKIKCFTIKCDVNEDKSDILKLGEESELSLEKEIPKSMFKLDFNKLNFNKIDTVIKKTDIKFDNIDSKEIKDIKETLENKMKVIDNNKNNISNIKPDKSPSNSRLNSNRNNESNEM